MGEKRRQRGNGPRGFSSEIYVIADAEVFESAEGRIEWTVMRGPREPPESLARGTFSQHVDYGADELDVNGRVIGLPFLFAWESLNVW